MVLIALYRKGGITVYMQEDPYKCGFEVGKFRITYDGREDGWYVLTVYQRHHVGLHTCMMDRDLFDWLFEEIGPDYYYMMKSGIPNDPEYPKLKLCEGDGVNTVILLKKFYDVIVFDQHFGVTGMKKLMEEK